MAMASKWTAGNNNLYKSLILGAIAVIGGLTWLFAKQRGDSQSARREHEYHAISGSNSQAPERNTPHQGRHPLDEALDFVKSSERALKDVTDYTAVFSKTELVHDRLLEQTMDMKFRERPFSVYLHCHSKHNSGREVIFVAGQNNGKMVVHEAGLKAVAGTMNLELSDPKIMDTNRHPITDVGIAKIIESAVKIWMNEKKTLDPDNIEVRIIRSVQAADVECEAVEISHRHPQPGLTYQIGRVYVDKKSKLPVQAEMYDWPAKSGEEPPLLEQYIYTNIKTNVGLSDSDFDPTNREYSFKVSQRD